MAVLTQGENNWLDLAGYQDLVVWLDVKEVTLGSLGSVPFFLETSATKDESGFVPLIANGIALTGAALSIQLLFKDSAYIALARWLRWKINFSVAPSNAWDLTFRLWIAASAPGAVMGLSPVEGRTPQERSLSMGDSRRPPRRLSGASFVPPPDAARRQRQGLE